MRDRIRTALNEAMLAKDEIRTSTLRLMLAAFKDRDIALRGDDGSGGLDEAEMHLLMARMVKQREETAETYAQAGRMELAERERAEIAVIRDYLPRRLDEAEVAEAIRSAIDATGARSIRDMGKVMGQLKSLHPGQIDFSVASAKVKAALG